jgi:hypothetical protein
MWPSGLAAGGLTRIPIDFCLNWPVNRSLGQALDAIAAGATLPALQLRRRSKWLSGSSCQREAGPGCG